ncbi:MAG: cell division protein FtsH [Candidatus Omnitrophica bacterium 4484_213]|nr:MAG: cell division protein FtsH [Candidatus Omnitrophica bacterium 4484_213]
MPNPIKPKLNGLGSTDVDSEKENKQEYRKPDWRGLIIWLIIGLFFIYLYKFSPLADRLSPQPLSYPEFYAMVLQNRERGEIKSCYKIGELIQGELANGKFYRVYVPENDTELMKAIRENVPDFEIGPQRTFFSSLFFSLLPIGLFIMFIWFMAHKGMQQGAGRLFSFGKSRAKLSQDIVKTTFEDVAGVDEAKEELQEIVEFLKNPKKFQKLGGKIPKGVLLMGPPGCGKTILARAVAGEAGVPFFSISGSDFVEMFVGVGASRVRDLFGQARKAAKAENKGCIIFEREQTLNALLVEMDGFDTREGVILIGATNRPDVLDIALLRPGRFDRQIVIDKPDIKGREGILKVHTRKIKLAKDVDLNFIACQTPGFSGADLANLANEAALLAVRHNKEVVGMEELEASIERVMAGPERKSRVISEKEKKVISAHESGHALLSLLILDEEQLHKVSILPRGASALGYTMQMPLKDRYLISRKELLDKLTVLLGGRASEELMNEEITSGAQNDLEVATEIARQMVCEFGMSRLGNLTFGKRKKQLFLGRDILDERNYSEKTAQIIDEEIRRIIDECYQRAKKLLSKYRKKLELLASTLLKKEVLSGKEVREIVGIEAKDEEQETKI